MNRPGLARALLCFPLLIAACDEAPTPVAVEIDGAEAGFPPVQNVHVRPAAPEQVAKMWSELPAREVPADAAPFDRAGIDPEEPKPIELDQKQGAPISRPDEDAPPSVDLEAPPPTPAGPTLEAQEREVPVAELGKLRVIDAGAEPREVVALAMEAGSTEKVQLDLTIEVGDTAAPGQPPAPDIPPMRFIATKTVKQSADGSFDIDLSLDSFDLVVGDDPQAQAMAQASQASMKGIENHVMSMTVSSQGRVTSSSLAIPDGVTQQAAESFRGFSEALMRMLVTFPEEAIGVGAQWSVTEEVEENGIKLSQTNVYTLVSRDGDALTLSVESLRTPTQEFVTPDQAPPGLRLHIVQLESQGKGELEMALGSFAARKGKLEVDTKIEVEVQQDKQTLQTIKSTMKTTISASPT